METFRFNDKKPCYTAYIHVFYGYIHVGETNDIKEAWRLADAAAAQEIQKRLDSGEWFKFDAWGEVYDEGRHFFCSRLAEKFGA